MSANKDREPQPYDSDVRQLVYEWQDREQSETWLLYALHFVDYLTGVRPRRPQHNAFGVGGRVAEFDRYLKRVV